MRSFDPRAVGRLECRAWETYYRRRWGACLIAFVLLVRAALVDLYACTYAADPDDVRPAASLRAEAMVVSDRWVAAGCDVADPQLAEERALLVRSFAALLAAVHRP